MSNRPPEDRTILVTVDPYTRDFHYTNQADESDASSLTLINGDRLIWVLDSAITPRTFQIDFAEVNPFDLGEPVSLRGIDFVVSPYVEFPLQYIGGRQLKYSVLLGNGWRDDPDVVPSPTDPGSFSALAVGKSPDSYIMWTDASQTDISLNPAAMTAAVDSSTGLARVSWQWAAGQANPQPFTLTFGTNIAPPPPPPWAGSSQNSTKINPSIVEFLGAGSAPFTITTTNINGAQRSQPGTLTIS